jgi:hypothetical protein
MKTLLQGFMGLIGSILFFSLALKYHGGFTADLGAGGTFIDRFIGTVDTMGANQGHA